MLTLLERLWNTSPRGAVAAVKRRLDGTARRPVVEPGWVRVSGGPLAGHDLWLAPGREPAWREMAEGRFDAFMLEALKDTDLAGATIWDIGAHFGYHTLCFAALTGSRGKVVAFEPNPTNQERLRQNLERNPDLAPRVEWLPYAISDHEGEVTFVFSDDVESGLSSNSHVADAVPPLEAQAYAQFQRRPVQAVTIDGFFYGRTSAPPQVIKIDVEGAEALVLSGARRFLAEHRPTILMEVHHITAMLEVQALLMDRGYRLQIIGEDQATTSRCFVLAKASRPAA